MSGHLIAPAAPRWVATLARTGEKIVGKPSWLGNGGSAVRLPDVPMTDWQRLMERCRQDGESIQHLSLFAPPYGWFHSPTGKAGYGYYEVVSRTSRMPRARCEALSICWWEEENGQTFTKIMRILPSVEPKLEYWRVPRWLPCMIGIRGNNHVDHSTTRSTEG